MLHFLQDKNARRRGLGIEIALLVLLAVFAMSALLVSTAVLERDGMNSRSEETLERLVLDQIGENFCAAVKAGNSWSFADGVYESKNVVINGEEASMQLTTADSVDKLEISLKKISEKWTVTQWVYH